MSQLEQNQLLVSARRAFDRGDLLAAREQASRLVKLNAKHADGFAMLGQVASRMGRLDEAATFFQTSIRLVPREPAYYVMLATVRTAQSRPRDAVVLCEKALKLAPGLAPALLGKADAHLRVGECARARKTLAPLVERGGAIDPAIAATWATIEHDSGDHAAAVAFASRIVAGGGALPRTAGPKICSILGKSLEKLGEYDRAFDAFVRGNAIVAGGFDPATAEIDADRLIAATTAARLAAVPKARNESELAVFIAGMPRSGTTLIERIIDAHPLAYGAGELTLIESLVERLPIAIGAASGYPECLAQLDQEDVDRLSGEHIEALGRLGERAQRVVDKYYGNYRHLALISRLFPRAKIIHSCRHPLDTCVSCFVETLPPSSHPWASDLRHLGVYYRQYRRVMEHWRRELAVEMLDVQYEQLVAEPERVSREIIGFCGLEWDERCLRYHEHARGAVTLSYEQVRKPIYRSSVKRYERYAGRIGPLIEALGDLAAIGPADARRA